MFDIHEDTRRMVFDDEDPAVLPPIPEFTDPNTTPWESLRPLFLGFIESNSVTILRNLIPGTLPNSGPFESTGAIKGPIWICSLHDKDAKTEAAFEVFCPRDVAVGLASLALKKPMEAISDALAKDFLKEYVNQVMGGVKRLMAPPSSGVAAPVPTTTSVPQVRDATALDTLAERGRNEDEHVWTITLDPKQFFAATKLELDDNAWKACLNDKKILMFNYEGSIEFL